jgi:hypothetical protein
MRFQIVSSRSWASPVSQDDLNRPNRRMRTRLSGGVGGAGWEDLPAAPIPIHGFQSVAVGREECQISSAA